MTKRLIAVLMSAALIIGAAGCGKETAPGKNTEVWKGSADMTFSQTDVEPEKVQVGQDAFAFLRVTMGTTWLADEISDARLYLTSVGKAAPDRLRIGLVTGFWDDFITFEEAKQLVDERALTTVNVSKEADGRISIPLKDYVKTWLNGGMQNNGLAIFTETPDKLFAFASAMAENEDSPYILASGAVGNRAMTYGKFAYKEMKNIDQIAVGNCISYALRDADVILEDELGEDKSEMANVYKSDGLDALADYIARLTLAYVEANKDGLKISAFRQIDDFDSEIDPSKEYRIALRVGVDFIDDVVDFSDPHSFDFHFWAQLNDGRWAQKFPTDTSQIVPCTGPGISPGKYPWDSAYHRTTKTGDYYKSKVIYFAVTKDTDEFTRHMGSGGAVSAQPEAASLPVTDVNFTLADASGIEVKEYNLGEGTLKTGGKDGLASNGKPVPCPLDGVIALPKGEGAHPLVVIVHGVHKNADPYKDKNYLGFDYLVKQLAAQGFVAVAYNHNIEYQEEEYGEAAEGDGWGYEIYRQQMEALAKANAGDDSGFDIDLKGKIDMENVNLIGHSAGGGAIWGFAGKDAEQGRNAVKSLLFIAPAIGEGAPPNIPVGILLAENDEQDLAGNAMLTFDGAKTDPNRTAPAQVVYLRGATHAYFNHKFDLAYARPEERARYEAGAHLSREQQEDFFTHYVCQFLDVYAMKNDQSAAGVYDTNAPEPSTMYGYAVTASFWTPESKRVVSPEKAASNLTASGNATAEYVTLEVNDRELLFQHGGGMVKDLPMYRLRWTDKTGAAAFAPNEKDFSGFSSLDIYAATISSEALNAQGEGQALAVVLKDASGKESSVIVPKGTAALSWYPGEKIEFETVDENAPNWFYWTGETPLCDLRVPLALFSGVDLKNVTEITLQFDQTDSGAVMVSEILLGR